MARLVSHSRIAGAEMTAVAGTRAHLSGLQRRCGSRPPCALLRGQHTQQAWPRSLTSSSSNSSSSRGGTTAVRAALEDWIRQNGGVVSGARLLVSSSSSKRTREIVASEDLEPGHLIACIPRACQLRYDDVDDPGLLALFEQLPRGSKDTSSAAWQFRQALTLLWHISKGGASPLQPYFGLLPGVAAGVPTPQVGMILAEDAVQELQYMPIIDDVLNQKYWWELFCSQTLPAFRSSSQDPFPKDFNISKGVFGWAVAVTNSRSFGLAHTGTHAMPCFIDMVDHDPHSNCQVSSDPEGGLSLKAMQQIRAGERLRLRYGSHDNRNLLISYGFVLQEANASDKFEFDFDRDSLMSLVSQSQGARSVLAPWQEQLLCRLGLAGPEQGPARGAATGGAGLPQALSDSAPAEQAASAGSAAEQQGGPGSAISADSQAFSARVYLKAASLSEPEDQPVDPRLLAAVRVMTLVGDEARPLVDSLSLAQLGDWRVPLARQHELEVLKVLTRLCTALYQSLGTTLQQDRSRQQALEAALSAAEAKKQEPQDVEGRAATDGSGCSTDLDVQRLGCLDVCTTDVAAVTRDVLLAVRYRISIKRCLELALQAILSRSKELAGSQ